MWQPDGWDATWRIGLLVPHADIGPETSRVTTLGTFQRGQEVNLERVSQAFCGFAELIDREIDLTRAVLPWHLNESDVHDVLNIFQVTGLDENDRYFMKASLFHTVFPTSLADEWLEKLGPFHIFLPGTPRIVPPPATLTWPRPATPNCWSGAGIWSSPKITSTPRPWPLCWPL